MISQDPPFVKHPTSVSISRYKSSDRSSTGLCSTTAITSSPLRLEGYALSNLKVGCSLYGTPQDLPARQPVDQAGTTTANGTFQLLCP